MSWEEYAKIILGNKKVAEIKKNTIYVLKKYTYGRYKSFIGRLKKECKKVEKLQGSDKNER